ncbi:hypothetical protein CL630_02960 [bacterium]|nr:hypothetical protein [bacterium]|tara:strand:- start:4702 stop:5232 length:531 start_codon:yes stop_codon:yes gene_type:complete
MAFINPEDILDQLVLVEGRTVAELGAGSGAYVLSTARRVGDTGIVYAIDVQKHFLDKIKNDAKLTDLTNVEVLSGDIEELGGTGLKDGFVDTAILSNTLFQFEDKSEAAREIRRILKTDGRVLVVDWSDSFGGIGPSVDAIVSKEEAHDIFKRNGFTHERDIKAGEHHYGMIFRKM